VQPHLVSYPWFQGHTIIWCWISQKRYQIRTQFQWNTNRDLHTPDSTEIICSQTQNWISHFTYSLLLHYFEKCNCIHFFKKLLNKSAMYAVISLLLQSRKFWWYLLLTSSMLLHSVTMTSYYSQPSDTQYLVTTVFQQDSAPAHRAAHVQHLNCCVKKRQTFLRPTCDLETAQISVL